MKIPLMDLKASCSPIKDQLLECFETILSGMNLMFGPNVQAFEREFAEFCEAEQGIGVSSGTEALSVALRALGIGPGDEVIVPSHTFFASVEAIVHVGATPVMVDIEPDNMTMDVDRIPPAVTPATKAIMPVHLYGHPVDMDRVLEIAAQENLRVIEDCAQAHGARYKGRRCGSMGDAAGFSFYFTKNLGACGEAGFVTTRDAEVAEEIRRLRHHGHVSKFEHAVIGYNLRMDELQAAVLRLKLPLLEENNARRRAVAHSYDERFADAGLRLVRPRPDCESVYHLYPVRTPNRDALREYLDSQGIGTGIHYKIPAHRQQALRSHPHRFDDLTQTDKVVAELLSIPMYPELAEEQIDYVAHHVVTFQRKHAVKSGSR